jgi:hypothetical protein
LSLYRGPLLPDDDLAPVILARQQLETRFARLVKPLIINLSKSGFSDAAMVYLRTGLKAAPANDILNRLLAEYP